MVSKFAILHILSLNETGFSTYNIPMSSWYELQNPECQNHSYFTYLVWRPKFIAPHKLCLIKEADPDIPS